MPSSQISAAFHLFPDSKYSTQSLHILREPLSAASLLQHRSPPRILPWPCRVLALSHTPDSYPPLCPKCRFKCHVYRALL